MAEEPSHSIAETVEAGGEHEQDVYVEISYDVIQLLSDHLYSSPLKAIEELMVNGWDADATECRIVVPEREGLTHPTEDTTVCVWDDGVGMNATELADLWHVGTSHKRDAGRKAKRKQIGKFGIGKLATYVIARRVTYLTKQDGVVRGLTLDYERFTEATNTDGTTEAVTLDLRRFDDAGALTKHPLLADALASLELDADELMAADHWTLVVLEGMKPKAAQIRLGRLKWVLRTALPLTDAFKLTLNGERVESALESQEWLVDFAVHEIEPDRLESLRESTGEDWKVEGDVVTAPSFPNGISGRVRVASTSLYREAAKSEDLGRSHGFFIRVHERLINQADPLFGMKPLSYETFNRFIATIDADDLDQYLTAPRDDVEQTPAKEYFRDLLLELFNQARATAQTEYDKKNLAEKQNREGARTYVNVRLLERPLTDALVGHRGHGGDPDEWLLLKADADEASIDQLIEELNQDVVPRRRYSYRYTNRSRAGRLVEFDPESSVFLINLDHELVLEYGDKFESRRLLEFVVTAEALLEVYLREFRIEGGVVAQLIERRDELLRSLARDEQYSLNAIAQALRDAADDEKDLEVAVVAAARALGFVARHISYSGEPDGLAGYEVQGRAGMSFTLEAKSSGSVPSLGSIDFAGLREHVVDHESNGCMLVAPAYPGSTKREDAAAAKRAIEQQISCWRIEDLARVVELAERRHINAEQVQDIVFSTFAPDDVAARINALLEEPTWIEEELRRSVIEAIAYLHDRLPNSRRTIDTLAGVLATRTGYEQVNTEAIGEALLQLSKGSHGMLYLADDGEVFIRGSLDELRRRVAPLSGEETQPRRLGTLRDRGQDGPGSNAEETDSES